MNESQKPDARTRRRILWTVIALVIVVGFFYISAFFRLPG